MSITATKQKDENGHFSMQATYRISKLWGNYEGLFRGDNGQQEKPGHQRAKRRDGAGHAGRCGLRALRVQCAYRLTQSCVRRVIHEACGSPRTLPSSALAGSAGSAGKPANSCCWAGDNLARSSTE